MASMDPNLAQAIIEAAQRLGVDPVHLGTAISYETGGKMSPSLWGGKDNNYLGLIQFGPEERRKYGVHEKQSTVEQMAAVESFLRDRGVKPGMGLMDIYSTINAGSPGLYNRSDAANGGAPGTIADKVNFQMSGHADNARRLLGMDGPVGALASGPASASAGVGQAFPTGPAPAPTAGGEVLAADPASATAAAPVGFLANAGTLGQGLGKLGEQLAGKQPDFEPLQQIQMARPNVGQSQQIAAALAKAYGFGG